MNKRRISPFAFRISPEVKAKAKAEADRNRRSLNTELELLVEEALECRQQKEQAAA
ncbi:Arc family DNA-binding protein [Metapseudomonas sp. CR1201]